MKYKLCAIIPTYNHIGAISSIVKRLFDINIPIIIIDDGSTHEVRLFLKNNFENCTVIHHDKNFGKGTAVETGLKEAEKLGFTHAIQIDADGQHSLESLERFIDISRVNPTILLSGQPKYDDTVHLSRYIGRWITHVWVWVETLSFRISDSMCGFRVYPVSKTLQIMSENCIGSRMDFDTEIMVRHFWAGTPVIMSPVKVTYPTNNLSNFKLFRDNLRITKMHTKLVFQLLLNLKSIIRNRPDYSKVTLPTDSLSWARTPERGSIFGLLLLSKIYRVLGKHVCKFFGLPVLLYFFITGKEQRKASFDFLTRVNLKKEVNKKVRLIDSWKHFSSFYDMLSDKFSGWIGKLDSKLIKPEDKEKLDSILCNPHGGMILTSHVGNMEFCRAVSNKNFRKKIHVLLHSKNAQLFNHMLKKLNPKTNLNIIEVTEVGIDTIMLLKSKISNGEWIVIAADRVPVNAMNRVSYTEFLGRDAPFSQGPYIIASLLECPVYTAFAIKQKNSYRLLIDKFADNVQIRRSYRDTDILKYVQMYSAILEKYSLDYPYQWYNFFDYWPTNQ